MEVLTEYGPQQIHHRRQDRLGDRHEIEPERTGRSVEHGMRGRAERPRDSASARRHESPRAHGIQGQSYHARAGREDADQLEHVDQDATAALLRGYGQRRQNSDDLESDELLLVPFSS